MVAFTHSSIPQNSIFKAMKLQPSTIQIGLTVPTEDVSFQRFWENKSTLRGPLDVARFKVSRVLGHGGGGVVVKARLLKTTTVYAVKAVPAEQKDGEDHDPKESNIARFVTSCRVPFTSILLGAFVDCGLECIVTEIAYHGDLHSLLLRERGASLRDILRWTVEITAALCTLHGHGIIHRDLKPTNILIDAERHVRLTDWGMAYWAQREDAEYWAAHKSIPAVTGVLGTKRYMAPEMIAGDAYDAAIDWWALGVILYEIIVGRHPFVDAKGAVRTHLIVGGPVDIPQEAEDRYGSDAAILIRSLLNRNPKQRRGDRNIKNSAYFLGIDWDYLQGPFCDSNKVLKFAYGMLPPEDEGLRPLRAGDSQPISCSSSASSASTAASCSSSAFSFTSDGTEMELGVVLDDTSIVLDDTSMVYQKQCEHEHELVLPVLGQGGGSSTTAVDSPTELSANFNMKLVAPAAASEESRRDPSYLQGFARYFGL